MNLGTTFLKAAIGSIVVALACSTGLAQPTSTNSISLQAKLDGVAGPTVNLTVKFFDSLTGGTQQGSTIILNAVPVSNGIVSVPVSPVDSTVFNGQTRYMAINVNGGAELSPRTLVTSVPYALQTRGLFVDASQRVGIGTTSPQQRCVVGTTTSSGINRMPFAMDEALTIGTSMGGAGTRTGLLFENNSGSAGAIVVEKSVGVTGEGFSTMRFYTDRDSEPGSQVRLKLDQYGHVGIGTDTPKKDLVVGSTQELIDRLSRVVTTGTYPSVELVVGTHQTGAGTAVGLVFETNNRTAGAILVEKMSDGSVEDHRMRFYVVQEGNPDPREAMTIREDGRVIVPGTLQTRVLTITGADVAEPFTVTQSNTLPEPQPGMVVSIDPANPGKLTVCSTPYDKKVAGAISGAGGLSVGVVMGQDNTDPLINGDHPVAMSGRVYVWCDAASGAITPGDRLTTSSTPGHAMKATDPAQWDGAVIGKAMTELKTGKGLVLVLVNLQ